eukprot:jgi/Mesvir1/22860/Mv20110-RA.1
MLSPAACCRFSGGEPRGRRGWACAVVPTLLLCLAVTRSEAFCIDDAMGAALDAGCENVTDYLTGTRPAPICYVGPFPSGNTHLPGHYPLGLPDAENFNCATCIDDQSGSTPDMGCNGTGQNFCLDWGPDSLNAPNVMNNDGDYGMGAVCLSCINDQSGDTADTGCTDVTKPYCLPVQSLFLPYEGEGDAGYCVACLATPSVSDVDRGCEAELPFCHTSHEYRAIPFNFFGRNSFPVAANASCFACLDSEPDELGSAIDAGCSASQPFCGTTGPTINTNQTTIESPVDLGMQCYVCKDTEPGTLVDLGCGEKRPVCRVNYSGGYGTACDTINPSCYFSSYNIIPDDNAVCSTPYKLEALLSIKLLDCVTVNVSLPDIVANLTQLITPAVPACALELTVIPREDMISQAGAGTDISASSSRKLLQGPAPDYELVLALRVYVDSVTQGSALKDLLNSLQFSAYLSDALAWIGSVPDIVAQVEFDYASASVQSDPHFTTAAGNKFDFPGAPGQTFCIVSDKQVQVNARFMGAVNAEGAVAAVGSPSKPDTRTWMDQIGFMYGKDRVLIDAKSGPGTPFSVSFGVVAANGEMLLGRRATKRLPSGMTVSRAKTWILVTMPEVMMAEVEVVRAAFWEPGAGPGANFLNLQVKQFNNSASVHGVLGQSYAKRPDQPLVEGDMGDYRTSGILATDCRFDQFGSSAV